MSQAVQCPQCEKRFKLGDTPPATFTCTQCGTLMDLSAFGGVEPPPKGAATEAGGPQSPARTGARGRRRPAAARARRQGPPPVAPPKKDNTGAIVAVSVVVLALLILVIARSSGDDDATGESARKKKAAAEATRQLDVTTVDVANEVGLDKEIRPIRRPGEIDPKRKRKPRLSRVRLQTFPWPEEVDATTRAQVEEMIQDLYRGGRDGVEAREKLIELGHPICGRLISEFKAIEEKHGFRDRNGTSLASVIDNTLRSIDGWIERYWEQRQRITAWGAGASPQFVMRTAKRWTWWWENGEWKETPRKPWDPHLDESDESEDGIKRDPEDEEDEGEAGKKKDGGFGKRAGSG